MSLLKYFIALFLLISIVACSSDANEPENVIPEMEMPQEEDDMEEDMNEENVVQGDVLLTNQNEIDDFGMNNYTSVTGSVSIIYDENNPSGPEITSLASLNTIRSIGGNMTLEDINDLQNLGGLENIENIFGNIRIIGSTSLQNLNGIANTNFSNTLWLQSLPSIENIPNFDQITSLQILRINSTALQALNAFNNVTEITGEISISGNNALDVISGFQRLEVAGNFRILGNSVLDTISGFTDLHTINGDIALGGNLVSNLNYLQNIQSGADSIVISGDNSSETFDLSGLQNLVSCKFLTFSNINITSLESLESLSEIIGLEISSCPNLTSLDGLENLGPNLNEPSTIATFLQNENLTDFCAITNLVVNSPNIIFTTVFNGFDPTEQDIILGNCSM